MSVENVRPGQKSWVVFGVLAVPPVLFLVVTVASPSTTEARARVRNKSPIARRPRRLGYSSRFKCSSWDSS